jgi:HEPN domain-containing protein
MNRQEFQILALERLADAEALFAASRYSAAYYLSGYSLECALKACIARQTKQDDFPPRDAGQYYIHDLSKLLKRAGLDTKLAKETDQNPKFEANWALAKDWSEESRYQTYSQQQATQILVAIADTQFGVLKWLKEHW